jgi:hypothetical protein
MIFEPPPGVSRVTLGLQHLLRARSIVATFSLLSDMLTIADKSAGFEQELL